MPTFGSEAVFLKTGQGVGTDDERRCMATSIDEHTLTPRHRSPQEE